MPNNNKPTCYSCYRDVEYKCDQCHGSCCPEHIIIDDQSGDKWCYKCEEKNFKAQQLQVTLETEPYDMDIT